MSPDPRQLVGKAVRDLRKARNWSQEELAEKAGLHRNYIGGVERGERNVALLNIVAIAHALKVTPSQLIDRVR